MSAPYSLALNQLDRVAMLCDFLDHPGLKAAVANSVPVTMPPTVGSMGSDGDFAELLKLKLEKSGFEAWIDVDRLRVGDDWRIEIDDAIRSSVAVVVVVTPNSKQSEYVTYEWAFASGAGVKLIPLMVEATQMHPRLESMQYLDFTNRRARPWELLLEELQLHTKASAKAIGGG